ncbi:centromere protein K-like isoform X2 [Dendropsophus ebraccatus]|uniref:centromere protein K-like isoform X2 n=1 Tax=Dendropsophus ebraccatus TaxID=150705 RepID=UPI0038319F8D
MRVPATTLGKLRNLAGDLEEEKRWMEENEKALESVNRETEEVVEEAEKIEESTADLEAKIQSLKEQDLAEPLEQMLVNGDALPLPPETFQAPTMQLMDAIVSWGSLDP